MHIWEEVSVRAEQLRCVTDNVITIEQAYQSELDESDGRPSRRNSARTEAATNEGNHVTFLNLYIDYDQCEQL